MAEGPKLVAEALERGAEVESLFVDDSATGRYGDLIERARGAGAGVAVTAPGVLARACDAVHPQPVAATVAMLHRELRAAVPARGLAVVCVDLHDPGNAGAVLRSAAASGAGGVVFCAGAVDIYNPKTVRASAGALFHVPVSIGPEPAETLEELSRLGVRRLGAVVDGGVRYDQVDLTGPAALVLGGEARGLPGTLLERLDQTLTIPMAAGTESLNVAMAATVICFEAARQARSGAGARRA